MACGQLTQYDSVNVQPNFQHVRVGTQNGGYFFQFSIRLLPVAKFKPANRCGQMKIVWWF